MLSCVVDARFRRNTCSCSSGGVKAHFDCGKEINTEEFIDLGEPSPKTQHHHHKQIQNTIHFAKTTNSRADGVEVGILVHKSGLKSGSAVSIKTV